MENFAGWEGVLKSVTGKLVQVAFLTTNLAFSLSIGFLGKLWVSLQRKSVNYMLYQIGLWNKRSIYDFIQEDVRE